MSWSPAEVLEDEEQFTPPEILDIAPAPEEPAEDFVPPEAPPILLDDRFPTGEATSTPLEPVNLFASDPDDEPPAPIDMGADQANAIRDRERTIATREQQQAADRRDPSFAPGGQPFKIIDGEMLIDPDRYSLAVDQMWRLGLLDGQTYAKLLDSAADVEAATTARRDLERRAGDDPALKSFLTGAGASGAMLATGVGAARATGVALSAAPLPPPVKIGASLLTGAAASVGTGLGLEALAQEVATTNETVDSLLAARELRPGYNLAGSLATIAVPAGFATRNLANAVNLLRVEQGPAAAAKFTAGVLGGGAAIGAGVDIAAQFAELGLHKLTTPDIHPLIAAEQARLSGRPQAPAPEFSPARLGLSTTLGALTAGLGVKSRNQTYQAPELVALERRVATNRASRQDVEDYNIMRSAVDTLRKDDKLLSAQAVRRATVDVLGTRALDVTEIINPRFQQQVLADAGFAPPPGPAGRPALPYAAENPAAAVPAPASSTPAYTGQTFLDRGGPAPAFQGGTATLPGPAGIQALPGPTVQQSLTVPPPPAVSPKTAIPPVPVEPTQPAKPAPNPQTAAVPPAEVKTTTSKPTKTPPAQSTSQAAGKVVNEIERVVDTVGIKPAKQIFERVVTTLEGLIEESKATAGFQTVEFRPMAQKKYGLGAIFIDGQYVASVEKFGSVKPKDDYALKAELPRSFDLRDIAPAALKKRVELEVAAAIARKANNGQKYVVRIPGDGTFKIEANPLAVAEVLRRIKSAGPSAWRGVYEPPAAEPAAAPSSKSSGSKSKADAGPAAAAPPPPKPAAPPPQETYTDAQVYADYPEAVGVQRAANGAWTMPVILGATDKVPVIEMPELVEIFRSLSGGTPRLRALRKSLGLFHPEGTGQITLHPKLFVDEKSAMMTLAHEIGHFVDYMDDLSMTKGNVLGIVAGLSNYLKHHIPLDPNAQMSEGWAFSGQPITKSERAQIRAQAEEDLIKSLEGELRRVIVEEPVYAQAGVTPDTVRELFGLDAREKWPEMYDWFARQTAEVKKEIVKKAMKGLVDERIAKFAIQGEQIGTTTREEIQNIGGRAPTPQEFRDAIDNAMRAEMQARNVADLKYVRDELIALSSWWKPFDLARAKDSYVRYRLSAAELYADALSVLFNSPADLEKRAPVFWTVFWNYMDARPQVKAKLMEVQERILKGKDAVLDKRLQQDIEAYKAGAETFIRKHEAAVYRRTHLTGWWDDLKDQYWNRYQPIIEAAAKARAAGKITPAEEDAYRWLTEQHPLADSKLQVKLADIGRIYQDLDAAGVPRYYFGQYLEVKRAMADRAQMANPGGKTPRTAQEMLDYLTGQLGPEKTAALEASVSKFRDVVFDILTDANDSGLFSPDLWQTMLANRDSYATFTPVEYVEEYLPAAIRKQVGTLASIADPAQQTMLKVIAIYREAQNNRFIAAAVQAIREVAPEAVKPAPVKFNGKAMVPQPPRDTNFRLVQWKRQGQLVGVHLPLRYARMWDDKSPAERDAILRLIQTGFSRFVYAAIIRYNPAFQLFMSPARDLQRSLTNMPGGTKGRALFLANLLNPETWGASLDWARGDVGKSALMREMIENMAVGGPHTAFGGRNQSDDDAINTILRKFHLMEDAPRNAFLQTIMAPLKGIEFAGQILQLLPKAAAYRAMVKQMGVAAPQAANTIRNHIGIPNYYKRGRNVQTAGAVIPFLNIFLRSYESLWRNMSGKERNMGGKEWWLAWLLTGGGLTAILQTLAKEGVFGEDLQRLYSRVPDYDMTNYAVIPLGEVPTGELGGKTVYARLPQDEGLRVINGVVQKVVTSAIRSAKGDPTAPQMGEVLAGVTATVPGVNPVVSTADAWVDYMRGLNPRDNFRNRSILSDDEYLAGGLASTRTMLGWTLGETGVTNFFNYDSQADTLTETTISATPVLNRFIKITDRGLAQGEEKDRRLEERDMARFRVGLPDFVKGLRTEYSYLQRLGEDRSEAQELRYNELKFWRRGYQQNMDQIETAMEMDNRSEVLTLRNFLIQDSQYYRPRD